MVTMYGFVCISLSSFLSSVFFQVYKLYKHLNPNFILSSTQRYSLLLLTRPLFVCSGNILCCGMCPFSPMSPLASFSFFFTSTRFQFFLNVFRVNMEEISFSTMNCDRRVLPPVILAPKT